MHLSLHHSCLFQAFDLRQHQFRQLDEQNQEVPYGTVAECAVIGIPHEKWGEQVHGVIRLHVDKTVNEQEMIDHAHTLISGFKCPRSISFVTDPLPLRRRKNFENRSS